MGKLGAWELNFSSDIDLIFCYEEDGELSDRKNTTYGEFFTHLARQLVKVLDEVTADGFVFRTDTRLRPFGSSGPLVMTLDGMENYYQTQAREWERYAMIKVRPVAGDIETGKKFMAMIRPFVYRRYLDYGAFEELRSLKFQIIQELQRKDRMDNIKLGLGGIREIEFIGQAFQLIRGGNEKQLQERRILKVLDILGTSGLLSGDDAKQLQHSYAFLRKLENHIQQYQDRQTHDLPGDELARLSLTIAMGYSDWGSFTNELDAVRQQVHHVFEQVFSLSENEQQLSQGAIVWTARADSDQLVGELEKLGYKSPEQSFRLIENFKYSTALQKMTTKGRDIVDRLMPKLLLEISQQDDPDRTLKRIVGLLEKVAGRNVYLALLSENPDALTQLVKLSSSSVWICDYMAQYPVLFDELLDPRSLYEPMDRGELAQRLNKLLVQIDVQDTEQLMYALRKFKHISVLHVAAADIMGVIPVMQVSDYLTYIAEVILNEVVNQVWRGLTEKHGFPDSDAEHEVTGFAVLGFGKLGGMELGYGSDLDLVFLYDCLDGNKMTTGSKPISISQFYGRLGQKVMSMLNTKMLSGQLYEVDMRLRPSGKSGLLVSHVDAYDVYMENDAWTWEHQALVRGRFVAGDFQLKNRFEKIRAKILSLPRDCQALKIEVREMREKMRSNQPIDENIFDLKHSQGGIADIEFIVQFGVLAFASQNRKLLAYTDNVRLLEELQNQGFISLEVANTLMQAYCAFRDRSHREVLQGRKAQINAQEYADLRAKVKQIWHEIME
jgi:glutamate-ammonia-ligase adenylyltransferase